MTNCEITPFHNVRKEIEAIVPEHYEEAKKEFGYDPVNVDWEYFSELSKHGNCFVVSLKEENNIVGYAGYIVSNDPLRKDVKEATNVCMYVKRGFRGIGTVKMLYKAQRFLSDMGINKINYLIRSPKISRILERAGYLPQETLWSIVA